MAVTVDGLKITLTSEGGTGWGSESSPYTWAQIMLTATDIEYTFSSGGKATKFYYVPYALYVEADCYMTSSSEMVLFGGVGGNRIITQVGSHLVITSGQLMGNGEGFSYLYDATITDTALFNFRGFSIYSNCTLRNVSFYNAGSTYFSFGFGTEISNCSVAGSPYGVIPRRNLSVDVGNKYFRCGKGILLGYNLDGDVRIESPYIEDCTYDLSFQPLNTTNYKTVLVDPYLDFTKIEYLVSRSAGKNVTLQVVTRMSFALENATGSYITVYDKDDNIMYEGDYEEDLEIDMLYYNQYVESAGTTGIPAVNDITIYYPFKLVVSREGYDNLEIPNIVPTIGQPTAIRGSMVEVTPPIYYQQAISGDVLMSALTGMVTGTEVFGTTTNH